MQNTGFWVIAILCGVPAFVAGTLILFVRAVASRRATLHVERYDRPAPEVPATVRRVTFHLELEKRQLRERRIRKVEEEEAGE